MMVSDNAKIFVCASSHRRQLSEAQYVRSALEAVSVEWKFIPSRAPHFGGVWERMVGMTKICMKKLVGKKLITAVELNTLLCEIECQINNRPLTYASNDLNEEPITPALLMYGRSINCIANKGVEFDELSDPSIFDKPLFTRQATYIRTLLRQYWLQWKSEYLKSLRERDKNLLRKGHSLTRGDIVLICDESPRSTWNIGRIEELYEGSDGIVRAVKLRTKNGFITRPVVRLINLEIHSQTTDGASFEQHSNDNQQPTRTKRDTAIRARDALSLTEY
jgi:hypothetical protein